MIDYRQSGVDVEEGYRAVDKYKAHAARTKIPGVLNGLGSFAGMFEVPAGMKHPVMVSGTDGVGTKLDVAFAVKKYDTVGIDCVAMSVNDILCTGARPLYFLDYIACGKLDAAVAADLVKGVSDGCVDSNCALLGGETAEMPGFYDAGKYDMAGFGVGIAEKDDIITGERIDEGDVLIGLSSTGVHSNGFSLVRKLVSDFAEPAPFAAGKTMGDALLTPTRIYVRPVLAVLEKCRSAVHGMVHITGGGFYENIPRMYPAANEKRAAAGKEPLVSVIEKGSWDILPVFDDLVRRGADPDRMFNTFNMGIGFILAVSASAADGIIDEFKRFAASDAGCCAGMGVYKMGRVAAAAGEVRGQADEVLFE
ncbi:phosphoribosylformylglycinamidine cyclo-ligase [Treponema brennaborense]|uniref:Phosphoribosylformylglycinamidine cyclo-ligase n=1 Tax=Treponema brennaborense (strain DSM 12168 / CIP 105900 / DD5/3) TaxID=906968 RepID=F4LQ76_TREBD|nr:phosphoribosylformylglycinamidine cyclo-ligase [Treponema brennaborense]AEE16097.1 phosphoribosylformylglycinamidine cyclo-ligase [Treponema brennaborense DSM 12168]